MSDLLIRDIDADLKRRLEERAQTHKRSLSEEAKALIQRGLAGSAVELPARAGKGLGTWMMELVPEDVKGDDLVFEVPEPVSEPPDFR